jgi:SAM-dependent methyltransferase
MPKINYHKNTFNYFKTLHPEILNGTVLDYGSNYGTFLDSSNNVFPEKNYTGIDIDETAISEGKKLFPDATFILYNGFNHVYNPQGIYGNRPTLVHNQYDTIISYSVLTHTSVEDMVETIEWLYSKLKPSGKMLLTWLDVDDTITTNFFYNKRIKDMGYCDIIKTNDYAYLNNNELSKIAESKSWLLLFFKKEYLSTMLQSYKHTLVSAPKNALGCIQSCIIIEK